MVIMNTRRRALLATLHLLLLFLSHLLTLLSSSEAHGGRQLSDQLTSHTALEQRRMQLSTFGIAYVSTGTEFVDALLDPSVSLMRLGLDIVDVPLNAWNSTSGTSPVVIKRNFTIEGNPEDWPILRTNYAAGKIRLFNGITFTFKNIFLDSVIGRDAVLDQAFLLFAASPPGASALVVIENCGFVLSICLPERYLDSMVVSLPRPESVPGKQLAATAGSQADCINSTDAPPMTRCWPYRALILDVAGDATNPERGPDGSFKAPTYYIVWLRNVTTLCAVMVSEECIAETYDATLCYLQSIKQLRAEPSPSVAGASPQPPPQQSSFPLLSGVSVTESRTEAPTAGGSTEGGSDGGGTRVVIPAAVASAGGALLLVFVAVAAWVRVRRRRRRTETEGNAIDSGTCNGASSKARLQSCLVDTETEWAKSDSCSKLEPSPTTGASNSIQLDAVVPKAPRDGSTPDAHLYLDLVTPDTDIRSSLDMHLRIVCHNEAEQGEPVGDWGATAQTTYATVLSASTAKVSAGDGSDVQQGDSSAYTFSSNSDPQELQLLPVVRGRGAFGRVVEGMYSGKRVAVKLLHEHVEGMSGAPMLEAFAQTFIKEVQILGRIRHPNVVRLLAASVDPARRFLVMELMDMSLERLIHGNTEVMPLPKVLHIGICIANALAYLHPTITHSDLKPANVLINNPDSDRPIVKLSDFGMSRLRLTVVPTMNLEAGTPPYMAPECFDVKNSCITHHSDVYSLGVLLWELLTGLQPWKGMSLIEIAIAVTWRGCRPPLQNIGQSRCPTKLSRLLRGCWETDPFRRPAAAEVVKELTLLLQQLGQNGEEQRQLQEQEQVRNSVSNGNGSMDTVSSIRL